MQYRELLRKREAYAVRGNIVPFAEMVMELENVQLDRYPAMMKQGEKMIHE